MDSHPTATRMPVYFRINPRDAGPDTKQHEDQESDFHADAREEQSDWDEFEEQDDPDVDTKPGPSVKFIIEMVNLIDLS